MNTVRINGQDYTSSLSDTEIAFIGNLSLPTTAQTLSGAIAEHETDISELNSNIASATTLLTTTSAITTTETSYNLSEDYRNYLFLMIDIGDYNNILNSIVIPSSEFDNTTNGRRPILYLPTISNNAASVYKNTTKSVYIVSSASSFDSKYRIRVRGCIKINNYT